ncbi:single-stranded DNA-binding protein, mitochondrial [Herrania umbratica]|uniref:Single-stranded DNA-binding protein, mitochondrial n=1 Tax=Herrania umbratica TaxID=108875 RepID=A0A6J1AZB4_9ROSI|nr:single-stranded DNA-binding protein, mitochondrial [Herrania umbratica]
MAKSMAVIKNCLSISSLQPKTPQHFQLPLLTPTLSSISLSLTLLTSSDSDSDSVPYSTPSQPSTPSESYKDSNSHRRLYDGSLENGLDVGVYKAILVGQVGQTPVQKKLKNGLAVTMFSVATGGIRNNRRPYENEEPQEYANRCAVQWHRICVYQEKLGELLMKHVVPGMTLYLEGNLETKIFTDPITGLVRRIREVSIRRNGRVLVLGKGDNTLQATPGEVKGVGF